jgi:hypothetical protein
VAPRAGNKSVWVASGGRSARLRLALCVDVIVDPSGSWTTIGFCVIRLLWQGTSKPLKCPVVPVSAIAV